MQWLQPWNFLWAALLIPAIIVLYLLKRRYTDRTISSTLLWQRMIRQLEVTHPWQRLQRHLLLWLQLLAAALLIAALARPAVPTDALAAEHTVILLDTSGSMLTREDGTDRLTQAKEEVIELANCLRGEKTMSIVQAGDPPRVIVAETNDKHLIKERINELSAHISSSDPSQSLSLARALASRTVHSEVILIGDGSGWDYERNLAPDHYIAVGKKRNNLTVAELTAIREGERVKGFARLENTGTEAISGVLSLYDADDRLLDTEAVEVQAGTSQTMTWDDLPISPYYRVELRAEQDALDIDNERWAVPTTTDMQAVLYIGEGNLFLEKALRLNSRVEIVKETDADHTDHWTTGHYPLYILNGIGTELPGKGNGLFFHLPAEFAGWKWGGETQPKDPVTQNDHPILEHVSLVDMYVAQARELTPPLGWETLVRSGDLPLIVATETDEQRFIAFTFELEQSDLPLRPEFPVLIHRMIDWLLPESVMERTDARLDEPLTIPVSAESGRAIITEPSGETTVLDSDRPVYTPEEVGLYEVQAEEMDQCPHYFTVSFPEEESEIAPRTDLPTLKAVQDEEGRRGTDRFQEVSHWLSLVALLLLVVEWVVFVRGY